MQIFEKIPFEIAIYILSFDKRFTFWNGKLISHFSEKDQRYKKLEKIPRIRYFFDIYSYVNLIKNKKYEIVLYNDYQFNCIKIVKKWFSILRNNKNGGKKEYTVFYKIDPETI